MMPSTNVSELRAVLGIANYYQKFVENYSTIATPLITFSEKMWHGTGLKIVRKPLTQ
jgi:hypothetical protein